ncbi:MAG: trimethylamine methyltransferase family protein, partial [Armatimonadota bacterium]|nr:trimethylamine methyltransferase family protein [Armatimonadota bacterium]
VENQQVRGGLAELGGEIEGEAVRFPPEVVEELIDGSERPNPPQATPTVRSVAGVSVGRVLDPQTGHYEPWTEPAFAEYVKLAHHLEHVQGASLLGCPFDYPHALHPLYQRLVCYRHGARSGGSLWDARLLPFIEEMTAVIAQARSVPFGSEWNAAVYLQSPLKFGSVEAEHFAWCTERGYSCAVGHMMAAGATGPATIAGSVALFLAEHLFIALLRRAFYGDRRLRLHCSVSVLDMHGGIHAYGAPERPLANMMMAQMARHYGVPFSGHGGATDAKAPSVEAGAQKVLTCLPILLCGGSASISAGRLSSDEVYSPLQMVIDNELVGCLKRFAAGVEVSGETLAVDVIREVGPGGQFLDAEHTAEWFRREHWLPEVFTRQSLASWMQGDRRTDIDRAREVYDRLMALPDPPRGDPAVIEKLQRVIDRAAEAVA